MNALAVGGFLGLLIGALFCKTYGAYWDAVLRGIGSSTSVSIVVILLVIGMFTKLMAISGVSQGFVWMAHMVGMPGSIFTAFTFLAACLITTATGSSIGTLTTVFPILYPAGILLGSHPAILAGAILSGAIFGDYLAPISDVTIASTTNQRFRTKEGYADIAGTVGYRLKYALIAGGIALVLFAVFGGGSGAVMEGADDESFRPTWIPRASSCSSQWPSSCLCRSAPAISSRPSRRASSRALPWACSPAPSVPLTSWGWRTARPPALSITALPA
ncbi:MAG: Na+/H+ antiporter NhaC family protein [Flavonifractor plautii]